MSALKKQQKLYFQTSFLTLMTLASLPAVSQALEATCALPYVRGLKGNDCNGVHSLEYEVRGGSPSTTVNAQLLALDENGTLLHSLPVTNHDSAQLKSRLEPKSYRWRTSNSPSSRSITSAQRLRPTVRKLSGSTKKR